MLPVQTVPGTGSPGLPASTALLQVWGEECATGNAAPSAGEVKEI